MQKTILVVDDEKDICELIILTLKKMGLCGIPCHTLHEAKKCVNNLIFDAILTDLRLSDGNGCELVEYVAKKTPNTPIAVITAHGNMEIAIEALKKGAFDFISKPIDIDILRNLLTEVLSIQEQKINPEDLSTFIGNTPIVARLKEKIIKVSRSGAPVFINGPSGSGKELVARLIHDSSARRQQPFIPVNCGAIPTALMESEFFGHIKGSFTGADTNKIGLFEAANKGTLFLDEIADLPIDMQVKLLRCLQEKSVRPVGANKEMAIDVRVLSATHKNLQQLVNEGLFREDLYYRLHVIDLTLPSLKERMDDLGLLSLHLLNKIAQRHECSPPTLTDDALTKLMQYHYPGNIRELENILERAFALCDQKTITESDIEFHIGPQSSVPMLGNAQNLDDYLLETEKSIIVETLQSVNGNVTQAAKKLGVSFRTLRYRLKKLGIDHRDAI